MALNYKMIGASIKKARRRNRLTQEQLAAMVNITASYLSYIESGKKKVSLNVLVEIANALGVTANELLAFNLLCIHNSNDELASILKFCSPLELKLITQISKTIVTSLRTNERDDLFFREND